MFPLNTTLELAKAHQRELRREAELYRLVKAAQKQEPIFPAVQLHGRLTLGDFLIAWGYRVKGLL